MKMKRFFIFAILFQVLAFVSFDVIADLAKDVESRYNALKSWSADFDQTTYVEMLKQELTKKGKIYVARPSQLRIEYLTRPGKIYASNGKKMWVYKDKSDTAYQFNKPKKVISQEAWSFLSGLKNLSTIFDIKTKNNNPIKELEIHDKKLKNLFLTPKNKDAAVLNIILGVDAKDLTVKEAVMLNTSGNVTHYVFKNIAFDPQLNESLFELPKKPKRKIIKK